MRKKILRLTLLLNLWSLMLVAQQSETSNEAIVLNPSQKSLVLNYADSLFQLLQQNDFSFIDIDTASMSKDERNEWVNRMTQHANLYPKFFPYLALQKIRYTATAYKFSFNCGFSMFQEDPNPNNLAKYYSVFTGELELNPDDNSVSLKRPKLMTTPGELRKWFYRVMSNFRFEEIQRPHKGLPAPPFFVPDFMEDEIPAKYRK